MVILPSSPRLIVSGGVGAGGPSIDGPPPTFPTCARALNGAAHNRTKTNTNRLDKRVADLSVRRVLLPSLGATSRSSQVAHSRATTGTSIAPYMAGLSRDRT